MATLGPSRSTTARSRIAAGALGTALACGCGAGTLRPFSILVAGGLAVGK